MYEIPILSEEDLVTRLSVVAGEGAATHPFVPQLVFGALGATSGVLVSFLPETRDAEVPDTLEEATRR